MVTKKSTEVATVAADPFAVTTVPDYIKQGTGRGSEEVKSSDMVLPRLEIVQALSPIKELDPDAREGMLFNSVTQEIIGDHAYFVPVYFRMEYLVWQDQDSGGGFHGSFPTLDQAEEKRTQVIQNDPQLAGTTSKGTNIIEVVDTPVHYGLRITPEGEKEQIVISMAKTKSKVSRKWNAMIQIAGGDRFSRVYKISAFTDENKKGQKFKNFVVQPAGFPPKAVYEECERLYASFRSGEVVADHASAAPAADAAAPERGEI
ncbi:MAG: hypothetical protein WAV93_11470 [Bacteroidales bacterium]